MNDAQATPRGLEVVAAIGREFDRLQREGRGRTGQGSFVRWGRGTGALALMGGLVVAVAGAGAATGLLSVGDVVPGGGKPGPPAYGMAVGETIVATGTSPVAGPWRLGAYASEGMQFEGEVLEAQGTPCLRLVLSAPPAGTPLAATALCGGSGEKTSFAGSSLPVTANSGESEALLFGTAPETSESVVFTGDGARISAPTTEGPAGAPGDVWVIPVPPGIRHARVTWYGTDDTVPGGTLEIPDVGDGRPVRVP
jgi:hypothetical protein